MKNKKLNSKEQLATQFDDSSVKKMFNAPATTINPYQPDFLTQADIGLNPLPHMPILASPNSAANKSMISKIWTNRVHLSD